MRTSLITITRDRRGSVRRGAALFIVLVFVVAVGVLALTAIVTGGNATLVAKSYARENDLKYAAEAALAIGKSRINFDAAALPDTGFNVLMTNAQLRAADNQVIPGVTVTVYVGPSGSTSGQHGRFASVVAEARDNQGNGFIRRLELTQESFAKYAYWSNTESNPGIIYFGNGDQLWGPVWSNDVIHIANAGNVIFHDEVGTAETISNEDDATFHRGYRENQPPIQLPPTDSLLSQLGPFATAAGWNFTAPTNGDITTIRTRIEFVAIDLNADGDSTDANEGFFKVYTGNAGQGGWARGIWPGTTPAVTAVNMCGDFHFNRFYPASVHPTSWFETQMDTLGMTAAQATAERNRPLYDILNKAGTRCYLGGSPQLAAVGRTAALGYVTNQREIGGLDNTYTPIDQYGSWVDAYPGALTPDALVSAVRSDASYLFPLNRIMNPQAKGVIVVNGSVGVSGTLRGRVTIYATGTIAVLDDIRYTSDPSTGICADILGLLSAEDIVVADNALLAPPRIRWSPSNTYRNMDDTKDLNLHGIMMALSTSFTVQNYDQGPTNVSGCEGFNNYRGCLYLAGGLIQDRRGAVGQLDGHGYTKRYSYDRCAVVTPPPYFPTTGRFTDNRYYELNPVGFNAAALYKAISSGEP